MSVLLLRQFILDLRAEFGIDLFAVAGNESRTAKDISWAGPAVTDNYDSIIYWMLELSLQGDKGLVFHPHQGNEEVFSIHKETFLLLHGHQLNFSQQKSVQSVMGKYAVSGVKVSHIIGGHIHSAGISDYSSRSSSLCGGDAYAYNALGYASNASQNIHLVTPHGIDSMKVDLQNTEEVDGYDCSEALRDDQVRVVTGELSYSQSITPVRIR